MARSPSSPIILPCPAKRVSAFSVVDGSVYRPPRIKCAPSPDRGIDNSALSAQMDLTLFVYTQVEVGGRGPGREGRVEVGIEGERGLDLRPTMD